MLDMVYAKSSTVINQLYDSTLVDDELQPLGNNLREQLAKDISTLLQILDVELCSQKTPKDWSLLAYATSTQRH